MHTNWEKEFFKDVALDVWSQAMTPEQTFAEAEFLHKTLKLESSSAASAVLDIPCGDGRHSIALARKGHRVTGVDLSEENIARASASAGALPVTFIAGDMRELAWEEQFEGAFCFGNSFCFLNLRQAQTFLRTISAALKPGGRLVIETGTAAESILPTLQRSRWYEIGGAYMLSKNSYDARESCLDIEYTFIRDGKIDVRPATFFVFTVNELCRMHEAAGLRPVQLLASIDGEAYQMGSPRLIIVSEK